MELRPPALDDFGLAPALERLTEVIVAGRSEIEIQLSVGPLELSAEYETALYRIVQEALTNIVRHADAHSSVVVTDTGGMIRAVIEEDDGHVSQLEAVRDGALGLVGMRERVSCSAAASRSTPKPGAGTTLLVELPG